MDKPGDLLDELLKLPEIFLQCFVDQFVVYLNVVRSGLPPGSAIGAREGAEDTAATAGDVGQPPETVSSLVLPGGFLQKTAAPLRLQAVKTGLPVEPLLHRPDLKSHPRFLVPAEQDTAGADGLVA